MKPIAISVREGHHSKLAYSGYGDDAMIPHKESEWIDTSYDAVWVDTVYNGEQSSPGCIIVLSDGTIQEVDMDFVAVKDPEIEV